MSNPTPTENGSTLPLRPALRETDSEGGPKSPKCGLAKVVSIAENEEEIPPAPVSEEPTRPKLFTASTAGKRLTGRPTTSTCSSRASLKSQNSLEDLVLPDAATAVQPERRHRHPSQHTTHKHDRFVAQVTEWLQAERARHIARKAKRKGNEGAADKKGDERSMAPGSRTSSPGSEPDISLEKLQKILEDNLAGVGNEQLGESSAASTPRRPSHPHIRKRGLSLLGKLGGGQSSDTECADMDVVVPSCDVVLDNSKTMSYTGGTSESSEATVTLSTSKKADKEKKAWSTFKLEILKLAHTLKLKGWRGVPFENSDDIEVERLSGALTNAVYVVSPPKELPPPEQNKHHRKPDKLLLRIYGPQVEHLIDRENELGILRRLARKKIGPRLLGTFENGRFEEFFNAQTLKPEDLVDPDTSKQIAKRMRELHDGVDLLEKEREEGPFVWLNWDKWVGQCEQVITYLDKEIQNESPGNGECWRRRGLICGVEWPLFRATVDKYRKWLNERYDESGGINNQLVFAHNDTQYGNILRLIPEKKEGGTPSPLLLPQNTHRQLIVIDFEYSSANTPGLEFANHFTEWCYNYHDEKKPWMCDTSKYPTSAQQKRFVRSYVNHRPQFNAKASATPKMNAVDGGGKGSISEFFLDARTPGGVGGVLGVQGDCDKEEVERERKTEQKVERLLNEAKWWRVANSAQWVAWGIVQAKVPELEDEKRGEKKGENTSTKKEEKSNGQEEVDGDKAPAVEEQASDPAERKEKVKEEKPEESGKAKEEPQEAPEEEEEEFDYLAYAQDRAMFFWGDVVALGLIEKEELPQKLRDRLKIIEY